VTLTIFGSTVGYPTTTLHWRITTISLISHTAALQLYLTSKLFS